MTTAYPNLGFDPAPGHVATVYDLERTAKAVANRLDTARQALRGIGEDESQWAGLAANAFARRTEVLPGKLDEAWESMDEAAHAFLSWANELVEFQRRATAYENQAAQAAASVSSARAAVDAVQEPGSDASQTELDDAARAARAAQNRVAAADQELQAILDAARRLLEEHGDEARRIADLLRRASEYAPAEPGLFESIGDAIGDAIDFVQALPGRAWNWIEENANLIAAIADVLSDISTVLAIVATVCMFIPPLQAAAGALFAASALFAGGALLGHSVAKAAGADVSWLTIGLDAVGVVTWGAGKIGAAGMANADDMYRAGVAMRGVTGFETGAEVIGAANFLQYARISKYSMIAGTAGLVPGTYNPVTGGLVGDINKYWVPTNPAQVAVTGVSPAGTAFWNAIEQGHEKDLAAR